MGFHGSVPVFGSGLWEESLSLPFNFDSWVREKSLGPLFLEVPWFPLQISPTLTRTCKACTGVETLGENTNTHQLPKGVGV